MTKEGDNRPATLGDINRLWDSVNPLVKNTAAIAQKLDDLIIPKQPCVALKEHLKSHEETRTTWKKTIIGNTAGLIKIGLVFLIGFFWDSIMTLFHLKK